MLNIVQNNIQNICKVYLGKNVELKIWEDRDGYYLTYAGQYLTIIPMEYYNPNDYSSTCKSLIKYLDEYIYQVKGNLMG